MKDKAVILTAAIVLIISTFIVACVTPVVEERETLVTFVSADAVDENDPVDSNPESAAEEPGAGVPDGAVEEAAAPASDPSAVSEALPVETAVTDAEPETEKETINEEEPWLEKREQPVDQLLANLTFPRQIRAVYNTAVPVVVTGSEKTADWRISFHYWAEGSLSASGIRLNREGNDFVGRFSMELLPGMKFYYNLRVEIPGPDGGVFDFPGGPQRVLNDGPRSYSRTEIERMFFYQPLFDIERRGDSAGARMSAHGWQFRELFLSEGVHRWSCRILYRKKGSGDDWKISDNTGAVWRNDGAEKVMHPYNLPLTGMNSGDVIEYYFELEIMDTNQFFELKKDNPPSFRIKSLE